MADYKDERLLTMAVPEDRPEIAKLKNDITIPTALVTQEVRRARRALLGVCIQAAVACLASRRSTHPTQPPRRSCLPLLHMLLCEQRLGIAARVGNLPL